MTTFIQNKILTEVAKALNGEGYVLIGEAAYSEDGTPASNNVSDFGSVVGPRIATSGLRVNGSVTFEALRQGTDVVGVSGDTLRRVMFTDTGSDAPMVLTTIPGIVHTENFDLSFQLEIEVRR